MDLTHKGVDMKITKKIKEKYFNDIERCPFCGSSKLTGDGFDAGDNQVWREIDCDDCNESWREIFTLTDIEEI